MIQAGRARQQLVARLGPAVAQARDAAVRTRRANVARKGAKLIAVTSVAALIASAITQVFYPELAVGRWLGGAVVGLWIAMVGGAVLQCRPAVTLRDVAERLDLAAGRHNVVATALELAEDARPSEFAVRAIAAGLKALSDDAGTSPAVSRRDRRTVGTVSGFAVGLLAAALAWLVATVRPVPSAPAQKAGLIAVLPPATRTNTTDQFPFRPSVSERETSAVRTAASRAGAAATDPSPTAATQPFGAGGLGMAGAASTDGEWSGSPSDIPAGRMADSQPSPSALGSGEPAGAGDAARGGQGSAAASVGNAKGPSGASAEPGGAAASTDGAFARSPLARVSDPAGVENGGPAPTPAAADSTGTGGAASSAGTESGPGDGQSGGGQDAKKSRGVTPMFLGTPEADLLQGPMLPGPERRSVRPMPPRTNPGPPRPAAVARPVSAKEPVVAAFRIPGPDMATVNHYFDRLHAESLSP